MSTIEAIARLFVIFVFDGDPDDRFNLVTEVGVSPTTVAQWEAYTPQAEAILAWLHGKRRK